MKLSIVAIAFAAAATGCLPPPSPTAQTCIERYAACDGEASMQAYVLCRGAVDHDCLPQKDGGAK